MASCVGLAGWRPASRARPVENPGRRLSGVATDGAADAQEVDVPAHDEQRVRNTHCNRITCNEPGCPGNVRHVDGPKRHIRGHAGTNVRVRVAIPGGDHEFSPGGPSSAAPRRRIASAVDAGKIPQRPDVPVPARSETTTTPHRSSGGEWCESEALGGVRAAHAAAALGRTLILIEAAPGAVLLRSRYCVIQAFKPYRASGADPLGLALPDLSLRLAFAVRTEEEQQVFATARGSILPTPVRAGKHSRLPTYLRHGTITSTKMHQIVRYSRSSGSLQANQSCPGTSVARYNASS